MSFPNLPKLYKLEEDPPGTMQDHGAQICSHSCPLLCGQREDFIKDPTAGLPWWLNGKNPPASTGDAGEAGLIPGLGIVTHPSILDWKIPWTEEAGRLHSWGHSIHAHSLTEVL